MSWQRIDENTYIDDTLVTCAEYQLFIDEMREQGKYYQPDHWTSHQFPSGQAHDPILGVRPYDARLFCEWLSSRSEAEKVYYRLPVSIEATEYPCKQDVNKPFGYWVFDDGNNYNFFWIGSKRVDVADLHNSTLRIMDAPDFLELGKDILFEMEALTKALVNLSPLGQIDFSRDLTKDRQSERSQTISSTITLATKTKDSEHLRLLIKCVEILIVDDRVSKKQPAFEGIRHVKERIR